MALMKGAVQMSEIDEGAKRVVGCPCQPPLPPPPSPSFAEALRFWLKLGFISFGGPTGQIAIMHSELVERKRWISEARFLHALNYCMLLPGPEAQQLAIYLGWLLHRAWGGIVAGTLFVLPSVIILWALSYVYVMHGDVPWIAGMFHGLKPAVTAIVAAAVVRIARKALGNGVMWSIAALAFVGIYFLSVPFPAIVIGAGLIGFVGGAIWPRWFIVIRGHGGASGPDQGGDLDLPPHTMPSIGRAGRVILLCGILWAGPILAAGWWLGWDSTIAREGLFFSKAAMVTFGGAYAVLPYVAEVAVRDFGWLTQAQMIDGLGLAESTPGPLIMVVQFVGFLGGWHHPGTLSPLVAATLGALITTWCTFVPCFLWIFLGAPHVEQLRGNRRLSAAMSTITASVVGVVLNLAVWFAHQVYVPAGAPLDGFAVVLSIAAFVVLILAKNSLIPVVAGGGLAGLLYRSFF